MRKKILTSIIMTAVGLLFIAEAANADLCLLKRKIESAGPPIVLSDPPVYEFGGTEYSLSSGAEPESLTPCTSIDTADGTADGVINYTGVNSFSVGDEMIFDVVFEQNDTPFGLFSFDDQWNYDGENGNNDMSSPDCSIDPYTWFNTPMVEDCAYVSGGTDYIRTGKVTMGAFTDAVNIMYNSVTFTNNFEDTETYALDFKLPETEVHNFEDCYLISGDSCGAGVSLHSVMKTNIEVTAPKCYVQVPSTTASVTCIGQLGCTPGGGGVDPTGNADITLTYPTSGFSCVNADCTAYSGSPSCSSFGVNFTDYGGNAISKDADGTHTETTALTAAGPSVSYSLYGVEINDACMPSSSLPSACGTGIITSDTAACKCGDPPTVSNTNSGDFGISGSKTYIQGQDIVVTYEIEDPDADSDGGNILSSISQVNFYYTNDLASTPELDSTVCLATLSSTSDTKGTIKCIIPGKDGSDPYVVKDTNLYFGVIVQDDKGLSGSYPVAFDNTDMLTGDMVDGTKIIVGTSFDFLPGQTPYPNQFPYRASVNMPLRVYFSYNEDAEVTLRIYSLDGMLIRQIENSAVPIVTSGGADDDCSGEDCNRCNWSTGCLWDGTTYEGGTNFVTNGMYVFNIHAVSVGGNFNGSSHNYTKGIVVMK